MTSKGAWREVFRFAAQPEVFLDADNARHLISSALAEHLSDDPVDGDLDARLLALRHRADVLEAQWDAAFAAASSPQSAAEMERLLVEQSAPMAAALGVWLQGLSAPAVFEDDVHLKILALLANDIGAGAPERSRHDAFRLLARQLDVAEAFGGARELSSVRSIGEAMFCWPALFFALSRRSDAFELELLGIDLAMRTVGLLPPWRVLARRRPTSDLSGCDLSSVRIAALAELASQTAKRSRPPQSSQAPAVPVTPAALSRWIFERRLAEPAAATRLYAGFEWAVRGLEHWSANLLELVEAWTDPRLAMGLLVQERAREAQIYHQSYKLEGKNLSTWFEEARVDPLPLVDAIARSKLVRPRAPRSSALIGALVRPDGPMFRIFSDRDTATILRWIESLAATLPASAPVADDEAEEPAATAAQRSLPLRSLTPTPVRTGDLSLGATPRSIREAYFLLQGRALAPRTRAFVHEYITWWTKAARASIDKTERSLPPSWAPGELRAWLLDAHDKHSTEFEDRKSVGLPSREDVIDQTLQTAPLTLIDGSWLQGFTDIALASSRWGARLFQTYWDELGNGQWEINHPKIYRDLLTNMGIDLPPTGSLEFALDARLRPESFRLPVYWLCVGKCPVTFRPEVLGMNLAMELSGVGGSYRSAQKFLTHYRFSTHFVDLHNTIDNVSTGHSAWAADAIDAHMQMIAELGDVEAEWLRVRTGFESLAPITRRSGELDFFRSSSSSSSAAADASAELSAFHHRPFSEQPRG
jgi:Iron-containing redox enzyme